MNNEIITLDTLAGCEEIIRRNLETFIEAGRALLVIRDNFKTWGLKDQHGTFEAYCRAKWGMSNRHANRLIEAFETVEQVGPIGPKPSNEAQARALAEAPPEKRAEVWAKAVETAPAGKVTAAHVKRVVEEEAAPEPVKPGRPVKVEATVMDAPRSKLTPIQEAAAYLKTLVSEPDYQWSRTYIRNAVAKLCDLCGL